MVWMVLEIPVVFSGLYVVVSFQSLRHLEEVSVVQLFLADVEGSLLQGKRISAIEQKGF